MTEYLSYQHQLGDGTLTGGEPTRDGLLALKSAGYTHLVSLRGTGESPNEASFFESLGFHFVHLPIGSPSDFSTAFLDQFNAALQHAPGKTVVFCATGNRVGAAFALHGHQYLEMSAADALAHGKKAGLTRLEAFVQSVLT